MRDRTPLALSTVNILELPVLLFVLATLLAHLTNTHTHVQPHTLTLTRILLFTWVAFEVGQSMFWVLPIRKKVLGKLISTTKISLIIFLNQQAQSSLKDAFTQSTADPVPPIPHPPLHQSTLDPLLGLSSFVMCRPRRRRCRRLCKVFSSLSPRRDASIQTQNGQRRRSIGCG